MHYSPHAPGLLFADDSGLEVDALGGAPGVYSARFAGPGATDAANNRLLREKLKALTDRTARFVCVIALVEGTRLLGAFRGSVEGRIIDEARGPNGFGYDPLFFFPPFGRTFGEAGEDENLRQPPRPGSAEDAGRAGWCFEWARRSRCAWLRAAGFSAELRSALQPEGCSHSRLNRRQQRVFRIDKPMLAAVPAFRFSRRHMPDRPNGCTTRADLP